MTEHSIEILSHEQLDQGTGYPIAGSEHVHCAFCSCGWKGDWWLEISHAIYGQAVSHLEQVGKFDPSMCYDSLGCAILQIDGNEVKELECQWCQTEWVLGPFGWVRFARL